MSKRQTAAERAWARYKQTKRPPDWNHANGWAYEPFMASRRSMARELRLPSADELADALFERGGLAMRLEERRALLAAIRQWQRKRAGRVPARRKA